MSFLVSTIISTHNRCTLLPDALRSALQQEDNSGQPIFQEIIVADDASTDNTRAVVKTFIQEFPNTVRYLSVRCGTPGGTRNAGAETATGTFLAFLDDDDVWLPGRLAKALPLFGTETSVAMVYGQALPSDAQRVTHPDVAPAFPPLPLAEDHPVQAFLKAPPHLNSTLIRREAFTNVGGFNSTLHGFEDVDLVVRLARRYICKAIPEPLSLVRFVSDNGNGAPVLWKRFQDETRIRAEHLAVRDSFRPAFPERVRLSLSYRGWFTHRFLVSALALAQNAKIAESRQAIQYALLTSPIHALRSPLFWQILLPRKQSA